MPALRRILALAEPAHRRRLIVSSLLACFLAPIELLGLALVLPLLELVSDSPGTIGGSAATVSEWTGITDPNSLALALAGAVVALFAFRSIATLLLRWWTLRVLFDAEKDMAVRLLDGYLHEPYAKHVNRNSAEVLRTLQTSVDQTWGGYVAASMAAFSEAVVAISIGLMLAIVQPIATGILVAYFCVIGPVYVRFVHRRAYGVGELTQRLSREAIIVARDGLDGIKDVTVLQRQDEFLRQFGRVRAETADARRITTLLREAPRYVIEVLFLASIGLLLAGLAWTQSNDDVVPALGVFVAAGFRLLPPFGRLMGAQTTMRSSVPAAEITCGELERLQDAQMERRTAPKQVPLEFRDSLALKGVTFTYLGADRAALRNLTFRISPGESVAIVGPSGSGKTTLVDLLLGLHEPTTGVIEIDGVPLSECLSSWRDQIGYVPQDVFLVDASLRQNIAFGLRPGAIDEAAVCSAVDAAHLADLVESLPKGLDTEVGERGVRLSGGQRQRIGIARALYASPSVLILDEATSALDADTEDRITETINQLRRDLTIIAIAHRLSTIRDFGRVLYLVDGSVRGDGSFDQLAATDPDFTSLVAKSRLDRVDT